MDKNTDFSAFPELEPLWRNIIKDLREAIWVQAEILWHYGPSPDVAYAYLCLDEETCDDYSVFDMQQPAEFSLAAINPVPHGIWRLAKHAFAYVHQLPEAEEVGSEHWGEVEGILLSWPSTTSQGEHSPFAPERESALKSLFEAFIARYTLFELDHGISVHQLALLSNMTVPAVRTSLSKEGLKLVNDGRSENAKSMVLGAESAKAWLSRRRDFIPQRTGISPVPDRASLEAAMTGPKADFVEVFRGYTEIMRMNLAEAANTANVDAAWLNDLADGRPVKIDISALRRVAYAIEAPEVPFVTMAVRHLLEKSK